MHALTYHSYAFVHIDKDGNEYANDKCTDIQAKHPLWIKFDCGRKWTYVRSDAISDKPYWISIPKVASFLPKRAKTPEPRSFMTFFANP